ncbi:uncharacterized protein LOC132638075 [Lycium barbarum]|uniref:uncharacterized protein LOC132638075 n=1 Tax=Lycium barbarum TaxID=112863 RepID=UPI00293F70EB|nr:uncharacterized protein LOC132638075 [Lycium barbarum]
MKIPPNTPQSLPRAAANAPPLSPLVFSPANEKGQVSGSGSRKRPAPHSFDPTHVHHQGSSHKHRQSGNAPAVVQDRVASLKPSIQQSEASTKAKGCRTSAVAESQLGQTNTSPAMQLESRLLKEVKAEIEDVAPDIIQGGIGEALLPPPPCTTVVQGINLSKQPTCIIDVNFLQRVAVAFEEVKANQEESTKMAKQSLTMNPSLEPTFLAIRKKHGDITKDCPMESGDMLTSVLEVICKAVQELQKKRLTEVDRNLLNSYYLVVKDAEKMKVNVNWLRIRLDEIRDAINCIVETKKINDEMNRLAEQNENDKKNLESMKVELEKLKSEIGRRESKLNMETLVTEELSNMINKRALRIQQFQNMPLMEAFP